MISFTHTAAPCFPFDNTYANELEGFFVPWQAVQGEFPEIFEFFLHGPNGLCGQEVFHTLF